MYPGRPGRLAAALRECGTIGAEGRVVRPRTVFLATFSLLWLLSARVGPVLDDAAMVGVARSIVVHGDLEPDHALPSYTVKGADDRPQIKYPLAWPILEVPGVALERVVLTAGMPLAQADLLVRLVRGLTPAAVGAAGLVLLLLALVRSGARPAVALVASASFHLATAALPYMRGHYAEVLHVATVDLGLYTVAALAASPGRVSAFVAGLSAGLLLVEKPALFPLALGMGAGAVAAVRGVPRRAARLVLLAVAGGAVAVAAMVAENLLRFGAPFLQEYGYFPIPQRIEWPEAGRAFGLLLSPGAGLLWYAPVVVLSATGARRAARTPAGLAAAVGTVGAILLYASYTGWHGAEQWGPRYLVPTVGPLAVLAAPSIESLLAGGRVRTAVLAALVAAGLYVNVPGVLVHYLDFYATLPYRPYWHEPRDLDGRVTVPVERDNLYHSHFVPVFSPIRGHRWLLRHAIAGGDLSADCPWREQVTEGPVIRSEVSPRVNLWFVSEPDWPDETRAMAFGILAIVSLAVVGAWAEVVRSAPCPPAAGGPDGHERNPAV